jgi:hypothetical protein
MRITVSDVPSDDLIVQNIEGAQPGMMPNGVGLMEYLERPWRLTT